MMAGGFPAWEPGFAEALTRLRFAPHRPAGGRWAGPDRSRAKGRGLAFADHRPYTPGDEPRTVDWRVYARHRRLLTRQYEEDRDRGVVLLLDRSGSMAFGEGEAEKDRWSRRLAAALGQIGALQYGAVQVLLLESGGPRPLPRAAGRAGVAALFHHLAKAPPPRESVPLPAALDAVLRRSGATGAPGPAVLISDLLDPDWPGTLAALGRFGLQGFAPALVQPLAPEEWHPPLAGELELEDAETGALQEAALTPRGLAAYRERLDRFLGEVRRECGRRGILHAALNTARPIPAAVGRELTRAGILTLHQ